MITSRRVLVVDADPDMSEMLAHIVRMCGHAAIAATAESALAVAVVWVPDVAVVDDDLGPELRWALDRSGCRVVVLTAWGLERVRQPPTRVLLRKPTGVDQIAVAIALA